MACGGEEGGGGGGVVVRGAKGRGRNEGGFGSWRRRPLKARISRYGGRRATAAGQVGWRDERSEGGREI
jgi:hypothetical protein